MISAEQNALMTRVGANNYLGAVMVIGAVKLLPLTV